jgi:hypothetical protein
MTGCRELWEVARFSGPRHGFQPRCDCYRTEEPPALHLQFELPGVNPKAVRIVDADPATAVYEAGMLRLEVPLPR